MNPDEPGPATTQASIKAESKKAEYKKALILTTARQVFAARGFASVTMKEIAQACGISRGGLYLYYASCEEILADILGAEAQKKERAERVLARKISAKDNLTLYLREEAQRCAGERPTLLYAVIEHGFAESRAGQKTEAGLRCAQSAAQIDRQDTELLQELIQRGVETGEFTPCETAGTAARVRMTMDGIRVRRMAGIMTEQEMDREIDLLVSNLKE